MRKIIFLIIGIIIFSFIIKIFKQKKYILAQKNDSCILRPQGINSAQGGYFFENNINFKIESGSSVCAYILSNSDFATSSHYLFEIEDGELIISYSLGRIDERNYKKYFLCENGQWVIKETTNYQCKNKESDVISNLYSNLLENNFNLSLSVTEDTLKSDLNKTPTPLPTVPNQEKIKCIINDIYSIVPYKRDIDFNHGMCINDVVYKCDAQVISQNNRINYNALPREIKEKYDINYYFYNAEVIKNCRLDYQGKVCNKSGESLPISSLDQIECVDKFKVTPTATPTPGSMTPLTEDIYGFNCGVPEELVSKIQTNVYGENHSKCCYIPKGYNTQEEILKASENLGCLIDTEILGTRVRFICYYELIASILKTIGIDNIVSPIQENAYLNASYQGTRACVDGLPLIPVGNTYPSSTRKVIKLSEDGQEKLYFIAIDEELNREDCRCRLIRSSLTKFCERYISDKNGFNKCYACVLNKNKIYTALGCFSLQINDFIKEELFPLVLGLAGLIALLCIIYSAIQLQTSQGSPEKIKKAQEFLTSCIMGLMVIIFSVFILKVIGVDILKIPGFGK